MNTKSLLNKLGKNFHKLIFVILGIITACALIPIYKAKNMTLSQTGFWTLFAGTLLITILSGCVWVHEQLHKIGWSFLTENRCFIGYSEDLKTYCCVCDDIMTKRQYMAGLILPLLESVKKSL